MSLRMRPLILLLLCCGMLAATAGTAQAEQLRFSFDDGKINIGEFRGYPMTDPQHPDMLGALNGFIDPKSGDFTSPPGGLYVPPRTMHDVTAGGFNVDADINFIAARAFSGHFDRASGALDVPSLDLTATLSIYPAGQAGNESALLARCQVTPVPLPLRSTGAFVDDSDPDAPVTYPAAPFDPDGASVSSWNSLPASVSVGGSAGPVVCPMIDDAAAGPGSLWMSGRATVLADRAGASAKKCKKRKRKANRDRKCRKHKKR